MRYDGLEKRLEALLAGRASGYAGLFDALLRAAKRAKKAEDHSANATAQASSVDDALLNHFMRALALAFDEAAQAGSVCVRFGAIEGALVLLKALDGSLDEAFDAKRGGDYSRVSAESVKATSGKARSVSERAEELPDDLRDALSDLFEGSGLESIPEVRRRAERATLEAGLEALYQLKLVSGLAEIERAAEALDAKRVSSVAVQSDPKLANQVNRESRAAFRLAPLAADVARVGFLKAQAGIDSALISKGRLADRDFEASRLYLAREALEEMELSETLLRFASQPAKRLRKEAVERVDRLSALLGADTYQRAAIELALRRPFAVISGGPGTGKTTTVVQILECLFAEKPDLRVALAAPTGKAASRMRQSIMQGLASDKLAGQLPHVAAVVAADANREPGQQAIRERTIHKWLLSRTSSGQRPSPESPFEADVLIIDEASMVDIHLAARLFRAVSPETRVIILGDKHQLAAVGPGAVFADISDESGALRDSVVTLRTSRRFPEGTVIAKLAKAINHETTAETVDSQALLQKDVMTASAKRGHRAVGQRADGEAHDNLFADAMPSLFEVSTDEDDAFLEVKRLLDEGNASDVSADNRYRVERHDDPFDERTGLSVSAVHWIDDKVARYEAALLPYLDAVRRNAAPEAIEDAWTQLWGALESFRPLAAQRHGPMSVDAINAYFETKLRDALLTQGCLDERNDLENWPGRVLIVRRNDDMLGVFNGDIGIVVPARGKDGSFANVVRFGDSGKILPPSLLPPADTAFAMTIHQSQGSEFRDVAVFLPVNPASGLATRELLYTGVTRTKGSVVVFGSEAALKRAVETPTRREGGLAERLRAGAAKYAKKRRTRTKRSAS